MRALGEHGNGVGEHSNGVGEHGDGVKHGSNGVREHGNGVRHSSSGVRYFILYRVPGKPQDPCCRSRGLQSDLMVGVACVKGSATPARLEASSCRSPSRYAARAHGTSRACSASQTSSYRTSAAAEATVSASSHPQPSFVAALVARALASATMSAVLSRPLRARGPLVSPATTRPPAPRTPIASPSALAPIRASMPTPRTRTGTLCWAAANMLRTTSFHGCERV